MLRPILVVGGTVAGLAAILSFKTHPAAPVAAPSAVPATPMPSASRSGPAGKSPGVGQTAGRGTASKPAAARTIAGAVESTQYGPMQVAVTLAGKKITGVRVLQQTDDGAESQQIDSTAIPELTRETLAAQGAQIDAVSGASYTSAGYKQSLQSALDKA